MHDHVALRIGGKDLPPQAGADGMCLAQGLVAVEFDMDMHEDPASGGPGLQVMIAAHPRPVAGQRLDPLDHVGRGRPVHQGVPGAAEDAQRTGKQNGSGHKRHNAVDLGNAKAARSP